MQTDPPEVLAAQSKRQTEALAKLTELELIERMAIPAGHVVGITEVRQIELEMQWRSIVASREVKASNDRASRWLIRLTGVIGILAVLQLAVSLHLIG